MNDWNIQARAHACRSCGREFGDRQTYHTVLLDLRHEIQRCDVCEPCWKVEHGEGARDRKGFISHWQGVYEAPAAAPPEPIQKENAESLLRKMIELENPAHAASCYILAVMLERKRILKVKEQFRRDGWRVFIYEHAKTGDVFTIRDPDLQLNQLEVVQREVAALLEHGFPPPAVLLSTPESPADAPAPSPAAEPTAAVAEPGGLTEVAVMGNAVAVEALDPGTPTR